MSYKPFAMAILVAANSSFASPIGCALAAHTRARTLQTADEHATVAVRSYQTNTMVWGPGGYKFSDFVKIGLPVDFIFWIVTSLLCPLIWPF